MDMYDEETGTKMDDEELRAQVMYFNCKWAPSVELVGICIYKVSIKVSDY